MNWKQLTSVVVAGAIATWGSLSLPSVMQAQSTRIQFICNVGFDQAESKRLPTTYAWYNGSKRALIRYTKHIGKYTPQRRCDEISPRFQEAYDNGSLIYLTNGMINNQPVICSAKKYAGECITMLLTLRPEDDSIEVLNELTDVLYGRVVGPIRESSGIPQVYYKIDLEEALRNAPVE